MSPLACLTPSNTAGWRYNFSLAGLSGGIIGFLACGFIGWPILLEPFRERNGEISALMPAGYAVFAVIYLVAAVVSLMPPQVRRPALGWLGGGLLLSGVLLLPFYGFLLLIALVAGNLLIVGAVLSKVPQENGARSEPR